MQYLSTFNECGRTRVGCLMGPSFLHTPRKTYLTPMSDRGGPKTPSMGGAKSKSGRTKTKTKTKGKGKREPSEWVKFATKHYKALKKEDDSVTYAEALKKAGKLWRKRGGGSKSKPKATASKKKKSRKSGSTPFCA